MAVEITPPSGTVTFLFTDIEGSTELWERDRASMEPALERHDAILRSVIEGHGGYVFSTSGDAFAAAFGRSADAVTAAGEAQATLEVEAWPAAAPIRVRMGLHVGEAQERDGDYFGPAVNRAARLMSAGHGGQVLLSDATAQIVGHGGLEDLGVHRLKGLEEPERVWQFGGQSFPPLRVRGERTGNLPASVSSFVGRTDEVEQLAALVEDRRLVTVVGPGGAGKSRLAVEAAKAVADGFADGAWWCDLQVVVDPSGFDHAVLDGVGATQSVAMGPLDSAISHMATRQLLLVIDNCEHLLDSCAALVERIGVECPEVRVLSTSREALNVAGEQVVPLGALDAAAELFVSRARESDATFAPSESETEAIRELCGHLDGLPLAIELAAARSRTMRPVELLERLDDRLRLLRTRRGAERHQTLAATVRWSFDMLSTVEQSVFIGLSVFSGSFDAVAAASVCSNADIDDLDVEDALAALVDRSMVTVTHESARTRFRLLETMRAWGEQRLDQHDEGGALRGRHSGYYCQLLDRAAQLCWTPQEPDAWELLNRDWDNVRVAVATAFADRDAHRVASLGELGMWGAFAMNFEIGQWARRAVQEQLVADADTVNAWRGAWGVCAYWLEGDHDQVDDATGIEVTDEFFAGAGLRALAAFMAAQARGDRDRAEYIGQRWLDHPDSSGPGPALAHTMWANPALRPPTADPDELAHHAQTAIRLAAEVGSPSLIAFARIPYALSLVGTDPAKALAEFDDQLRELAPFEVHFVRNVPTMYSVVASINLGDDHYAAQRLANAIRFARAHNLRHGIQMCLWMTAYLLHRYGQHSEAARMLGAAESTGYDGASLLGMADRARAEIPPTVETAQDLMAEGSRQELWEMGHHALEQIEALLAKA